MRQHIVAGLVLEHAECAEVFRRYRIDFCRRGEVTVEAAANDREIPVDTLVDELTRAIAAHRDERPLDPRRLSTSRLLDHIVSNHHSFLRDALPVVCKLASKVARVHGGKNPKLRDLELLVDELSELLVRRLGAEEKTLFPALLRNSDDEAVPAALESMEEDHHGTLTLLAHIRDASDDFNVPDWGCNSYRTLCGQLEALEENLFTHLHLENHVLLPRFATT